jgi:hypothetical protein
MSMPEQASRVATSTVDALKSQPLALALVIVNVLFLLGGMWTAHDFFQRLETASTRKDALMSDMVERCIQMAPKEKPP